MQSNLEVCTRCNACIKACPEQAIDYDYQVDPDKCKSHRLCVKACGEVGAIDFTRQDRARTGSYDLVLDLGEKAVDDGTAAAAGIFRATRRCGSRGRRPPGSSSR
jgi:MinD superfamily P-loop ATPase